MTDQGWAYVVLVKDWYTKQVVGHHCGTTATSREWLAALDRGLNRQFPDGVRNHKLHLMSDNGSQPTSLKFMKECVVWGGATDLHQLQHSERERRRGADDADVEGGADLAEGVV